MDIAIVEDQASLANSLKKAIDWQPGYRTVEIYPTAKGALTGIVKSPPDLVLMDISLGDPELDGVGVMARLKRRLPELRFLMFTVFPDDQKVFDALRFGADGYVLKSDGIPGVLAAIRELEEGGAPMSKEIAGKVLNSFHRPPDPDLEKLTDRETEVLDLLARGLLNKEIAARLFCGEKTVKQHIYSIYRKLQVNNRVEAANRFWRNS